MSIMVAQLTADELQVGMHVLENHGEFWGAVRSVDWSLDATRGILVALAIDWATGESVYETMPSGSPVIARWDQMTEGEES